MRATNSQRIRRFASCFVGLIVLSTASSVVAATAEQWAAEVTIHRDEWGVPHIEGPTDASVAFGFAYAQAQDYFWQIEDTYLQCIGRFAEVVGDSGLDSDLLNHSFRMTERAKADFPKIEPELQAICEAFAAGLNWYLAKHPETKPRLITKFEPWHVLAYERFVLMNWLYGRSHASRSGPRELYVAANDKLGAIVGSNAWAVSGSKTKSGSAMLLINPHQPWFGSGQFYEGHVKSGEGMNFSGSSFFGGPLPTMGHNENLGWAHTVNNPDVADVYIITFDDPKNPLAYRYGNEHKQAEEWQDTISVRDGDKVTERKFTFRSTHLGPIVGKLDDKRFLAVQIAKIFDGSRMRQALKMTKARTFGEWKAGMAGLNLQMFNTVYADREGNIFYVYNGTVPRRDPSFDWQKPVDGADPRTEWKGLHPFEELPQVLNPASGYVQNCNSTPFTTTDVGSPFPLDFPPYMVEEANFDSRRAMVSRMLLRDAQAVTFDDWQRLAFDTTLYWPLVELPKLAREFEELRSTNSPLAEKVGPYFEHFKGWDCRGNLSSTQATLCVAWYMELYGTKYPAEVLQAKFIENPAAKFEALGSAAGKLKLLFGDWRVPWGDVSRMQRHADVRDGDKAPFSDKLASIPCAGLPGPLGVVFNTYYLLPAPPERRKQYGFVGHSFVGVMEFGDKVQAKTVLQFGESADPESPHFFDQAALYSQQQFKPAWFHWDEVLANCKPGYHPGEETRAAAAAAAGN